MPHSFIVILALDFGTAEMFSETMKDVRGVMFLSRLYFLLEDITHSLHRSWFGNLTHSIHIIVKP